MKKWNGICMVLVLLYVSVAAGAQVIKIENGISIGSLHDKKNTFDSSIIPYQATIGIEYLDGGWYELSSSAGFLRKGGAMEVEDHQEDMIKRVDVKAYLDYLTVNTTFRVKKTVADEYSFYAGVGPRVDFKINDNEAFAKFGLNDLKYRDVIPGLKCELGVDYLIERYRVGLNFAYLPSFSKPIKESPLRDRVFTVGVVLGYVIN